MNVMKKLNHKNIIKLHEVYETTNSIYFVLDLLEGGELLHRVRAKGFINGENLKKLLFNFISALNYLHQQNIIHRDLKPENLLLKNKDNDTEIVIADFGLATILNSHNILFKRCGTPGFVAPEILNYRDGDSIFDPKCDIFSAGIIFYMLLVFYN